MGRQPPRPEIQAPLTDGAFGGWVEEQYMEEIWRHFDHSNGTYRPSVFWSLIPCVAARLRLYGVLGGSLTTFSEYFAQSSVYCLKGKGGRATTYMKKLINGLMNTEAQSHKRRTVENARRRQGGRLPMKFSVPEPMTFFAMQRALDKMGIPSANEVYFRFVSGKQGDSMFQTRRGIDFNHMSDFIPSVGWVRQWLRGSKSKECKSPGRPRAPQSLTELIMAASEKKTFASQAQDFLEQYLPGTEAQTDIAGLLGFCAFLEATALQQDFAALVSLNEQLPADRRMPTEDLTSFWSQIFAESGSIRQKALREKLHEKFDELGGGAVYR